MDKNFLVSEFKFFDYKYKNIYSAGPDLFFDRPCIGYVKKGYAKFLYKGNTYYAYEGDLIYIAFETSYQSIWYGSPDIEWYSVTFDFTSKYSFYNYRFQIFSNYPPENFDLMYKSYTSAPLLSLSYFYRILDDIYKKMEVTSDTRPHYLIEPAINYIEQNYDKTFPIETLASFCHISKSALFKQFKNILGVTPIEYKHNVMIQHAVRLLSNTDLSIDEISLKVGFSSSNYFRKIFTRLTDKTPKELRQK